MDKLKPGYYLNGEECPLPRSLLPKKGKTDWNNWRPGCREGVHHWKDVAAKWELKCKRCGFTKSTGYVGEVRVIKDRNVQPLPTEIPGKFKISENYKHHYAERR